MGHPGAVKEALRSGLPGDPLGRPHVTLFLCPDLPTLRLVFAVLGKGCFGISLTSISVYKPELYPTALR